MYKILMILRHWVEGLLIRPEVADDPLAQMTPLELADLPAVHPVQDE